MKIQQGTESKPLHPGECTDYDTLRRTSWPMANTVNVKLFGTKQELPREHTAHPINIADKTVGL